MRLRVSFTMPIAFLLLTGVAAAQDLSDVEVKSIPVGDGVWMLEGRGGNIGVSAGEDGVLLIDDQFAPLTDKIKAAVRGISQWPIRFVVNTHWHGDHTGGNENLGEAGAVIVAHENVRTMMSVEHFFEELNRRIPASPEGALPIVTFNETVTFHLNDDEIHVFHVPAAHTDGDSVIHFRRANVLHFGDVFFNGMYPFIDVDSGGSVDGMIAAVDLALGLADDDTKIIAGHGPVGEREALVRYRKMLAAVRGAVATLVEQGRTLEEVVAAKPTSDQDEVWAGGFIDPDRMTKQVYRSLAE